MHSNSQRNLAFRDRATTSQVCLTKRPGQHARLARTSAKMRWASLILVPLAIPFATSQVHAVAPAAEAAAFHARCSGTTIDDPAAASGAVPDLTAVFGARLSKYNQGKSVPLYDSYGDNESPYPPLCAVHSEGGTPVSEWMFCTDATAHACGETGADGDLIAEGVVVSDLEPKETNPKLTSDQERIIAFLIQHGHAFTPGPGSWAAARVSHAAADQGTDERVALQYLVWCISDQALGADYPDFAVMCTSNLPEAEQQRILATVPVVPELRVETTVSSVEAGSKAPISVETNLFNLPIHVRVTGGTVNVCPGSADVTLSPGGELIVKEQGPAPSRKILLCVQRGGAGTVDLSAAASPASPEAIAWDQSAYPEAGETCQHYATFRKTDALHVSASATTRFKITAGGTSHSNGTDGGTNSGTVPSSSALPDTGA